MLVAGGVQPSEVNMIYTNTAFEAAAAFAAKQGHRPAPSPGRPTSTTWRRPRATACWSTTQTANKLIADIWFARADFAHDHPDIIEGLVRGIFDGMEDLKKPDRKAECAKLMAAGYNIPADDALKMFDDAHNTNWAENYQFFLNQNNPTNFERIWRQLVLPLPADRHDPESAGPLRPGHGLLGHPEAGRRRRSTSRRRTSTRSSLAPKTVGEIRAESPEILTNTVVIHFSPNDWDLHKKIQRRSTERVSKRSTIRTSTT